MNLSLITFAVYLLFILLVTYYITNQAADVEAEDYMAEFFVGGRDLGAAVTAVLTATGAASVGLFVGALGSVWAFGAPYGIFQYGLFPLNLLVMGCYGKKIGIISRRINSNSFFDIFKERYEGYTPFIVVLVAVIAIFLEIYLIAEFVGGARIIAGIANVPYLAGLIAFGGIIIIYTSVGGLRGAGAVGVLQGFIMTVAVFILLAAVLGNFDNVFQSLETINPALVRPPGRGISWYYFISSFAAILLIGFGLPHALQGAVGHRSTKVLKRASGLGMVIVPIWNIVLMFVAIAGKVLNPSGIPPDQNIVQLTLGVVPSIPAGIVLAGIVGAAQTTIAAITILISSTLIVNIYDEYINPDASPSRRESLSTLVTAAIGIIGIVLAIIRPPLLINLVIFAIGGVVSSVIPPLLIGLYWPRANKYGALAASVIGAGSYIVLKLVAPVPISQNPILISIGLSLFFMIAISLMTKKPSREVVKIFFGANKE